jgi:hypothetical protein
VWGSLAALLYAGPANPESDVKTEPAAVEVGSAPAQADAAFTDADAIVRIDSESSAVPAVADVEADVKVALLQPEPNVSPLKAPDECPMTQDCIDQYLWSIYERARKIDTVKVKETIKVTVKKKGKTRTINKTITKLRDEDFTWKDPHAAQKVGMSMMEYVIGGMDRSFKLRLYGLFRALDDAGLAPGMTSGFRDDYRQSIATGNKAASDSSYHGGSRRGGYGHGLAADVVSVKGETRAERWISSEQLWNWIDANGKNFGIGRPYLDRDPPHIAPMDGKEYVAKRGVKTKRAGL